MKYFRSLFIIGLLVATFFLGRHTHNVEPIEVERVVYDTMFIEKPIPYEVEKVQTKYVYVHTPADTIVREVVRIDSVLVAVDVERRTYGDERYRAVVSGAVIGDIHPSLEEIDIYSKTETRIIEHKAPMFRPYIRGSIGNEIMGIGGGVSIKDRVDVDVQYMRSDGRDMVVFGANYRFNVKAR